MRRFFSVFFLCFIIAAYVVSDAAVAKNAVSAKIRVGPEKTKDQLVAVADHAYVGRVVRGGVGVHPGRHALLDHGAHLA